jgi:hypothetical protein
MIELKKPTSKMLHIATEPVVSIDVNTRSVSEN